MGEANSTPHPKQPYNSLFLNTIKSHFYPGTMDVYKLMQSIQQSKSYCQAKPSVQIHSSNSQAPLKETLLFHIIQASLLDLNLFSSHISIVLVTSRVTEDSLCWREMAAEEMKM